MGAWLRAGLSAGLRAGLISGLLAGLFSSGTALADPQTDYMLKCMGCHGPEGAEVTGKVPALKGHVARFLTVPGGRDFLVQVPGTRQSPLDDASVAALLNWLVRHFDAAHMPDEFMAYTGEEVARLRRHRLAHVKEERARLVDLMEQTEGRR